MIQTVLDTKSGRPLLLLGLSRDNCRRVLAGEPATVNGARLGLAVDVLIVGGETDTAIYAALQRQLNAGGAETATYTCCQAHADEAGIMHVPLPSAVPGDCAGRPDLPDV